jgi:protein SCO1
MHADARHNPEKGWHARRGARALRVAARLCLLRSAAGAGLQLRRQADGPVSDKPPAILNGVGIAQNLNQQLPLSLTFTDDAGKQVQLASYFGKKPAILALVYYQCPMLCSEELNGLTGALQMVSFVPGKDFDVIVVSIDPSEGRIWPRPRSAAT